MGRNRRPLTGFGKVLREFAEDEGVMGAQNIAIAITAAGYNAKPDPPRTTGVSRTAVDNWMKGQADVPKEVLPYIEHAFNLDEDKKRRLAYAFAWEQDFSLVAVAA